MADGPAVLKPDDDLADRVRRNMGRVMFAARWLMIPLYLGLMGALVLDAAKFIQKLVLAFPRILSMGDSEAILITLSLIDLSLVANLVVIVMFAGWETFIGPLLIGGNARGLTGLDFTTVKLKLFASITTIAAIQLLETFVHIDEVAKADAMLQIAILLGIGITGVLLAWTDRLAGSNH